MPSNHRPRAIAAATMVNPWYRVVCYFNGHDWVRASTLPNREICGRCHAVRMPK